MVVVVNKLHPCKYNRKLFLSVLAIVHFNVVTFAIVMISYTITVGGHFHQSISEDTLLSK